MKENIAAGIEGRLILCVSLLLLPCDPNWSEITPVKRAVALSHDFLGIEIIYLIAGKIKGFKHCSRVLTQLGRTILNPSRCL